MKAIYNSRSEAIETVYTYEEWLKEYNHRETKRRIRQRTERLYYLKQRLSGLIMVASGIIAFLMGMGMYSIFTAPVGMYLILTNDKIMDI